MKIVSWNLKNISENKLANKFTATFISFGLGNNVLDYMVRLVTGNAQWNNITKLTTNPVDVFVIIELKTSGKDKGSPVYGKCVPALKKIVAGMNTAITSLSKTATYKYAYVVPPDNDPDGPLIIGDFETVGVIYNTKKLTYVSDAALRNLEKKNYLQKKTPYAVQFKDSSDTLFQIIGVHAAPMSSGTYEDPIQYCNQLPFVGDYDTNDNYADKANTFFMGDFNCNPGSTYEAYKTKPGSKKRTLETIYPFTGLFAKSYSTHLSNNALSSLKKNIVSGATAPFTEEDYLSDAFDNIIMNGPAGAIATTAKELVVNTVGYARDMTATTKPLLVNSATAVYGTANCVVTSYNKVSDHLPVAIEW